MKMTLIKVVYGCIFRYLFFVFVVSGFGVLNEVEIDSLAFIGNGINFWFVYGLDFNFVFL